METNTSANKPFDLTSIKGLIDHSFVDPPYSTVRDELWKWFAFSVSSKGLSMSDLHETEFAKFSDQLLLIEAVDKWANLQKVSDIQKGGHSHA